MKLKLKLFLLLTILNLVSYSSFSQNEIEQFLTRQDSALIEKYEQNCKIQEAKGDLNEISRNLNAIAAIYWDKKHNKKAIEYYSKSLICNEKLENANGISMINNNLGLLYSDIENYTKSFECFSKTLAYKRTQKTQKSALISTLMSISVILDKQKKYTEAIIKLEEALSYAKDENDVERMRGCYGMLSELYKKNNDTKNSSNYFELYKEFNNLTNKQALDKYEKEKFKASLAENEKLKKEIDLINKEKELSANKKELNITKVEKYELELNLTETELRSIYFENQTRIKQLQVDKRNKTIQNISIAGFSLLVIIFLLFFAYFQKRKANNFLESKNAEILQQREEIMQQRDNLEEAFLRIGKQQEELIIAYSEIEKSSRNISESIDYANLIQTAMLSRVDSLKDYFTDYFIFFKPRDVVSGDFYWIKQIENKIIIAAVDCTGHGVPGAFISMIGYEFLNKIVLNTKITDPGKILWEMNKEIKIFLNQEVTENDDGMDMSICLIDKDIHTVKFAGAMNPLVFIQKNKMSIFEGNKHSLGGIQLSKEIKKFETTEITYTDNCYLYLFSDGFEDQHNEEGKRYTQEKLKQTLFDIHQLNLDVQIEKISSEFDSWKTGTNQTDDVLLIGLKL